MAAGFSAPYGGKRRGASSAEHSPSAFEPTARSVTISTSDGFVPKPIIGMDFSAYIGNAFHKDQVDLARASRVALFIGNPVMP